MKYLSPAKKHILTHIGVSRWFRFVPPRNQFTSDRIVAHQHAIWALIIGKRFQNIQSITIFCIGKLIPKANLGNLKRLVPFATKK